ncbi:hypothetical protein PGTUg99_009206 [Puccinia graminis f. sp. tritici]|uniref:Uncharacterized protein n=1 Tax=Puccinia graminis f. sp. tritici TaxID=56615 RepID=A0A5B0P6E7_PUCGR|nr:hypothetical protein PGTUg99_009206 [Puccinia graminis f. sp. tritici]
MSRGCHGFDPHIDHIGPFLAQANSVPPPGDPPQLLPLLQAMQPFCKGDSAQSKEASRKPASAIPSSVCPRRKRPTAKRGTCFEFRNKLTSYLCTDCSGSERVCDPDNHKFPLPRMGRNKVQFVRMIKHHFAEERKLKFISLKPVGLGLGVV